MKQLSFKWPHPFIKFIAIFMAVFTIVVILGFIIYAVFWIGSLSLNQILGLVFIFLVGIYNAFFGYYLYLSKIVMRDDDNLYVGENQRTMKTIPITAIQKIRRKYYSFYEISYSKDGQNEVALFYISPNPPLTMDKNIKQLKHLMSKNASIFTE